jgi:energy-coupling factor transporter ATP-binding protein EcfA2
MATEPMTITYSFNVPRPVSDQFAITLETGRSIVIIGANGSGKTRLGVYLEEQITPPTAVQRIAAHKSLSINANLNVISLERAENTLRFGRPDGSAGQRYNHRWGTNPAIHFLSDFDALLQSLFADHNRVATKHLEDRAINPCVPLPTTKLQRLKRIWDGLLPHRALQIFEASIKVIPKVGNASASYEGTQMSDGERAMFYFLGQCLVAPENGAIIIDEPEGHLHKSILGPLWDAIEKARPDCGFVFITHDLEFAVERTASAKYFISNYNHHPQSWDIEKLPENTGLPESVVAQLVGSRKPILFVEGAAHGSIDLTIYKHQYIAFTIVPIGSCDAVIRSVKSFVANPALHRLKACGLVDADHRTSEDIAGLQSCDIYVLPVAEIENILLLPGVFLVLAEALLCADPPAKLEKLMSEIMKDAQANLDLVSTRFTIRQIDKLLKRVEVDAKDLATLKTSYQTGICSVDPAMIFSDFKKELEQSIQSADLPTVLKLYDNKGLLARAASILGVKDQKQLMEKLSRLLADKAGVKVREELTKVLPAIPA